jgi:hypothetical protein
VDKTNITREDCTFLLNIQVDGKDIEVCAHEDRAYFYRDNVLVMTTTLDHVLDNLMKGQEKEVD